ncbi:hypothetical protein BT96DRAFT_835293 [Gymnopus androsaceus JB14]|uniref:Tc1-like transposase DDE domain-containing protein n=1 Tax=Gymnopus androsaceus JB14 TaxID=1447944 RepID=A0A6A4GTM1_9AGAR|nr:hypothetical protein BT96DRAFT_835293 [Gymnopus androsaceus JB14]
MRFSGCHLVYLPPYSPDYNPMKEGFSALKAWIRRNRDYVLGELSRDPTCNPIAMLWEGVLTTFDPEFIRGWYHNSGHNV